MDGPTPPTAATRTRYAIDLDGMLLSFPTFFTTFIPAMQAAGHEVGILTGRPASEREQNLTMLTQLGITPSFYVGKPDHTTLEDGEFKALACTALAIDVLFDDFEHDDPAMLASFFSLCPTTTCFTSWTLPPVGPSTTGQ
jgi:3-deoxy-D-manno-octulosonate 8-phosphate phosphatase KdsC-like HAD superfamily phosphatase